MEDRIGHVTLRRSERSPPLSIDVIHLIGNVVKQEREVLAAQSQHLFYPLPQKLQILGLAIANIESRCERIDKP